MTQSAGAPALSGHHSPHFLQLLGDSFTFHRNDIEQILWDGPMVQRRTTDNAKSGQKESTNRNDNSMMLKSTSLCFQKVLGTQDSVKTAAAQLKNVLRISFT